MHNRRSLLLVLSFIIMAVLSACKEKEKPLNTFDNNSAGAMTSAQFSAASNRALAPQDFTDKLNNDPYFTYESLSSDSSDSCLESKLEAFTFTRKSDNTFTLSIPETDVKDCYPDHEVTTNEFTVSFFIDNAMGKDSSGNTVDLSNMPMDALGIEVVQYIIKMRMHINMTHVPSGQTMDVVDMLTQHAITGFNDPCLNDGADGCRMERVELVHRNFSTPLDYTDKTVLESHDLGVVQGAPYFAGGTMTFVLNNWSGAMTYNSDPYTAPTYTATNGATTLNGTFTPLAPAMKAISLKGVVGNSMRHMARKAGLK